MTTINKPDDFKALDPFFRIIEEGLSGLVEGGHFFDLLADDVIFEYIITVPGYPRRVVGRSAVAELYRPYGDLLRSTGALTSPFITTETPAWSFSSTPPKVTSSPPGPSTQTGTSQ